MGGVNPYIKKFDADRPREPFAVTFVDQESGKETKLTIDPEAIPYGRTGLPGSILDLAEGAGLEIDHACGGVCACATCHVYVEEGLASCSRATDDEEDQIDGARGITTESRLSCQCVPNGKMSLRVVIPAWNRNMVKEGH